MKETEAKGWYCRGYLPHFDVGDIYQVITYRLGDSLPRSASVSLASSLGHEERCERDARAPKKVASTSEDRAERRELFEQELNKGYGSCILRDEEIAGIVVDAWKYFDGERYDLLAYVVMPNHVHVMIKTYVGFSLPNVVHSWKSFTGHEIGKILRGRGESERDARGPIWQKDYFDRFIRDEEHFVQAVEYIHENPVKAGLCGDASQWPWSSWSASVSLASLLSHGEESGRDARAPSQEEDSLPGSASVSLASLLSHGEKSGRDARAPSQEEDSLPRSASVSLASLLSHGEKSGRDARAPKNNDARAPSERKPQL